MGAVLLCCRTGQGQWWWKCPKTGTAACVGPCSPCPGAQGQPWGAVEDRASHWVSQQSRGVIIHDTGVWQPWKIPPPPEQAQSGAGGRAITAGSSLEEPQGGRALLRMQTGHSCPLPCSCPQACSCVSDAPKAVGRAPRGWGAVGCRQAASWPELHHCSLIRWSRLCEEGEGPSGTTAA